MEASAVEDNLKKKCLQLRSLPSSASASCCTLLPEAPLAPPVAPQGSLCNSCRFAATNRSGPDIFDNIPVELTSPVYVESRAFSFHTNRRSLSVEENPLTRKGGGGEDIRRGLKMISLVSHLDSLSRHAVTPEAIFFMQFPRPHRGLVGGKLKRSAVGG